MSACYETSRACDKQREEKEKQAGHKSTNYACCSKADSQQNDREKQGAKNAGQKRP